MWCQKVVNVCVGVCGTNAYEIYALIKSLHQLVTQLSKVKVVHGFVQISGSVNTFKT